MLRSAEVSMRADVNRRSVGSGTTWCKLFLLRTGGSDWHGDPEPGETHGALGSQEVPAEWLDRLDALRGSPPAPVGGP